jgi:hypothetical protein
VTAPNKKWRGSLRAVFSLLSEYQFSPGQWDMVVNFIFTIIHLTQIRK